MFYKKNTALGVQWKGIGFPYLFSILKQKNDKKSYLLITYPWPEVLRGHLQDALVIIQTNELCSSLPEAKSQFILVL